MRNGMDGLVAGAASTNADPLVAPLVVPSGRGAPSLLHALQHTDFTVNISKACAVSASSDLFISVISKPRALPTGMEQLFWTAATILVQVTIGTVDKASIHGAFASSQFVPRHSTYAAVMVGLVAFDGTGQTICVLFMVVVVEVVVVTAHVVALLWKGMAAMPVPGLHAAHVISGSSSEAW